MFCLRLLLMLSSDILISTYSNSNSNIRGFNTSCTRPLSNSLSSNFSNSSTNCRRSNSAVLRSSFGSKTSYLVGTLNAAGPRHQGDPGAAASSAGENCGGAGGSPDDVDRARHTGAEAEYRKGSAAPIGVCHILYLFSFP